jgi:hypothetical protein
MMAAPQQKHCFLFCIVFGLHDFAGAKTGCGSEMQNKKLRLLFCISLTLHYLCKKN